MAYSGTHEPTGFGESDSGNVLVVEIERPGSPPAVETIHTGGLAWKSINRTLGDTADLEALVSEIESLEHPETTLVQLTLDGVITPAASPLVARLEQLIVSRFPCSRLDLSSLGASPGDDAWISELPPGIVREAASRLRDLADPEYSGSRSESATPEVAIRALLELYAIASEEVGS
jgi:hypothetical protein